IESNIENLLTILIADNGIGMTEKQVESVTDPFYTTRTTRDVGLGIPFFKMAAEMASGSFNVQSEKGKGTRVFASFQRDHIDRMPMGDIAETVSQLICLNEGINIVYHYVFNGQDFTVSTEELSGILAGIPLNTPQVMSFVRDYVNENINALNEI
ncbi:MAG: sensor histidine kinase, partial [Clostridiales bacterium]|nr:sensor histidine kinase [Clostridiales bacterium]